MILIYVPVCANTSGQSREVIVKAGYIEKFTHFVTWPSSEKSEQDVERFTISVLGSDEIYRTLKTIYEKADKDMMEYEIREIKSVLEIEDSNVLFISGSEQDHLDEILEYTESKPILTIADSRGFGEKGVIINMFRHDSFIRYEVNKRALEKSGLKINSMLLNYAVILE